LHVDRNYLIIILPVELERSAVFRRVYVVI
jgi:hypothetical protein